MDDLRVAVLGAGRWGRNLVRNLHELGVLTAVADESAAVRDEVLATYPGVKVLEHVDDVLTDDVDAVVVATPAATHADLAIQAIGAGRHVFVEKPFTLTVADAERVVAEADAVGTTLMVGHLLLYQPAIRFLRGAIDEGLIGRPAYLNQDRLNLGTVRRVENALWSLGVHDVAALLHLTGEEPERIETWGQCVLQPGIEDDMHLHMLFPSGVEGHLHASWLWPERRRRLTIVGTEAMLTYDEDDHVVRLHRRRAESDLSVVDDGDEVLFTGDSQPLRHELEHFLACLRDGTTPRSDGRSAIPVIRVLEGSAEQLRRFE
jgi:predicted dehydrogenase